jgi:hypothetical protein
MSPAARRRIRRVGRVAGRAALIIAALLVLVIGGVIAALHTGWGREQVRHQVEALLDESFLGDVRIGRLSGSIFGEVVLHDVVIDDAGGEPAVTIERVRADLALVPLLGKQARFYEVAAEGVVVVGRVLADGQLNLAALLAEQEEAGTWDFVIDQLAVARARVTIDPGEGEPIHLDDVVLGASLAVPVARPADLAFDLTAWWRERGLPIRLDGRVVTSEELTDIPHLAAALGELRVTAEDVRIAGEEVRGVARIDAPAAAVRAIVGDSPLRGDVALTVAAAPGVEPGSSAITLGGAVGGAGIEADLQVVPGEGRARGELRAHEVDLAAILEDAPPTRLDATLGFELARDEAREGLAALRGAATLQARGRVEQLRIRGLDADVQLDHGRIVLGSHLRGDGGLDARAEATLLAGRDALVLEQGRLRAAITDLAAASAGRAPVRGTLRADLRARGRLDGTPRLAVTGRVRGQRLGADAWSARLLELTVDARGLPADPAGTAHLAVLGISDGERALGDLHVDAGSRADGAIAVAVRSIPPWKPWRIDVDALVRVGDDAVRVDLGQHRIRTSGLDWAGRGGAIRIDGEAVQVGRLRTRIGGGSLAIDGTYRHGGRRAGDFATSVHLDRLDLAEVDRSLDRPEAWRGRLDARVHVIRRGHRWYGSIEGAGAGLAMADQAPAIDWQGEARLTPGAVRIDARIGGRQLGAVVLDIDLATPRHLEDPAAWQRLERSAIRRGRIAIEGLDLAALARIAGITDAGEAGAGDGGAGPPALVGRLDGELALDAGEIAGTLRARGVCTPDLPAPLDADLTLGQPEAELVAAELVATLRALGTARAEATVAVPARPFDLAAWARLDADDVRGATLRVDDFVLDAERSRRLGLAEPWQGRVDLGVEVAAGLAEVTATVDARGLRGGPLARPVAVQLRAVADDAAVTGTVTAAVRGRTLLRGQARLGAGIVAARHDRAALRGAALDARVAIERASIGVLAETLGRDQVLVGTLDAEARVTGTVASPAARAQVVLRDAGVPRARIRELHAQASWDGRIVDLRVRGHQQDKGSLRAVARLDPNDLRNASGSIQAERFDLAPLAPLGPPTLAGVAGILDGTLAVQGMDLETARVDGELEVTGARLPLGGDVGSLRDGVIRVSSRGGRVVVRGDGRIGRGRLRLHASGTTRGLVPVRAEADIIADQVILLGESQPSITGAMRASLRRDGAQWRVDAVVRRGRVIVPERDQQPLHPQGLPADMVIIEDGRPPPAVVDPEASWTDLLGERPSRPQLIARVEIQPVRVETEELRGRVAGELTVTAGHDGVAIDGGLRVSEGSVVIADRRYRITRAEVRFDGPVDPILDIELVHDFADLTLFVALRGRLSEPDLQLTSQPATYSEGELLAILAGRSPGAGPGGGVRQAASGVAASFLSDRIGTYVQQYLPVEVDVLRFDPATGTDPAAFTIGKWLTRRLFVAYRHRLEARPNQNVGEGEVEYWLRPSLLLEGTVGDRGFHDIDLLWVRRW